jgi:hypothetical protein
LAGDIVDGGEIGVAVIFGRRTDADENGFAVANGLGGIGGVGNFSGFAGGRENFVKIALIDWHAAGIELSDASIIDIRAYNVVACLGKARSRNETNVTATNDRKTHCESPRYRITTAIVTEVIVSAKR